MSGFRAVVERLEEGDLRSVLALSLKGREASPLAPYIQSKIAAAVKGGARWAAVESYHAESDSHEICFLAWRPGSGTLEIATSGRPGEAPGRAPGNEGGKTREGGGGKRVREFEVAAPADVERLFKEDERPSRPAAWGDTGVDDGTTWFLAWGGGDDSSHVILHGYEFPFEKTRVTRVPPEGSARRFYDRISELHRMKKSLLGAGLAPAREVRLDPEPQEGSR